MEFTRILRGPEHHRWIRSCATHQLDGLAIHHPHVHGLHPHYFVEFGGDCLQQRVEFQSRVEDLFEVIHLRDPANRVQGVVAFALIGKCGSDGGRGKLADLA